MRQKFTTFILSLLLIVSTPALAQEGGAGKEDPLLAGTMGNVWTVVGLTGAGFILGLSTLSFVDDPGEEFLDTVKVGSAIGLILGVGVVAYMQATKSQELYEQNVGGPQASYEFRRPSYQYKIDRPVLGNKFQARQNRGASFTLPLNFTF